MFDVKLTQKVYDTIIDDLENERISLPRIPSHVYEIERYIQDESKSVKDISRLIEAEPSLIARILQIANSPLYGSINKVSNIQHAITRLGLQMTRNIILALAVRDVFRSLDPYINSKLVEAWNQSVEIAAITTIIAKTYCKHIMDAALVSSMLSNIGIIAVAGYCLVYNKNNIDDKKVIMEGIAPLLNCPLGNIILGKWNFPTDIVNMFVQLCGEQDEQTTISVYDLLKIAQTYLDVKNKKNNEDKFNNLKASKKLDLTYQQCAELDKEFAKMAAIIKQPFA